jgi:hypothetical protein
VLLPEETDPIDHLLGAVAGRFEAAAQTGVLTLEELNSLRGDHTFDSGRLETLETRLGLQRAPAEGRELVTEMLHQLVQLRERGDFRTCAF